jgi:hypothetical protein
LIPFLVSEFWRASGCTNDPIPTQIETAENKALPTNKFDKIARIAPSQNCSTWNNSLRSADPRGLRYRPAHFLVCPGDEVFDIRRVGVADGKDCEGEGRALPIHRNFLQRRSNSENLIQNYPSGVNRFNLP